MLQNKQHQKPLSIHNLDITNIKPSEKIYSQSWLSLKSYVAPYSKNLVFLSLSIIAASIAVLSMGQTISFLINKSFGESTLFYLNISLAVLLGLVVILSMGSFSRVYISSLLSERICLDIKAKVMKHLLYLNSDFHDNHPPGKLVSQFSHDLTLLQLLLNTSLPISFRNILLALGGLGMMFYTNWYLSITVIIIAPLIVGFLLFFGRRIRIYSKKVQEAHANAHTLANNFLGHIKLSQAYNHEPLDIQNYIKSLSNIYKKTKKHAFYRSLLVVLVMLCVFSTSAFLLWLGGKQVISDNLSIGALTSFIFYAFLTAGSAGALSETFADIQKGLSAIDRLNHLLAQNSSSFSSKCSASISFPITSLNFSNINFSYPTQPEVSVFQDFTLDLSLPRKIAIVGPSGTGKSTLFQLLLRFYPLKSGSITVNKVSIDTLSLEYWRQQLSWVPQETHFHNTTIQQLLRFGKPQASVEELWDVLKKAHLYTFIKKLPKGLKTPVGEQGLNFSAGQRQRLNLARALLKNAPILLLDEATSSLDAPNQKLIQETLSQFKNKTMLIIAHRLSTVRFANEIIVLDKGRVIDRGTHLTLLKRCPLYKNLCSEELLDS